MKSFAMVAGSACGLALKGSLNRKKERKKEIEIVEIAEIAEIGTAK